MLLTNANVRDAKPIDNVIVNFGEGNGMPKFEFGEQNAKLYIPQNGKDYAIVYSEGQGEMPLNFEANENGSYTITFGIENTEMNYLHLIDNMTGADIDLLVEPSYTFEANVSDYPSRFRLVFNNGGASTGPSTGSGTFAFINNGNIIVNGEGTVQVIDMMGRIIVCKDTIHRFSTNGFVPGVYVIRLIDGEDVRTQKMVIR